MPNGVSLASALKSWSSAFTSAHARPPRENSPIFTLAFASSDRRSVSSEASASPFSCFSRSKMASVWGNFFRHALGHPAQAVAGLVHLTAYRLLAGQAVLGVALLEDQLAADLGGAEA